MCSFSTYYLINPKKERIKIMLNENKLCREKRVLRAIHLATKAHCITNQQFKGNSQSDGVHLTQEQAKSLLILQRRTVLTDITILRTIFNRAFNYCKNKDFKNARFACGIYALTYDQMYRRYINKDTISMSEPIYLFLKHTRCYDFKRVAVMCKWAPKKISVV